MEKFKKSHKQVCKIYKFYKSFIIETDNRDYKFMIFTRQNPRFKRNVYKLYIYLNDGGFWSSMKWYKNPRLAYREAKLFTEILSK